MHRGMPLARVPGGVLTALVEPPPAAPGLPRSPERIADIQASADLRSDLYWFSAMNLQR